MREEVIDYNCEGCEYYHETYYEYDTGYGEGECEKGCHYDNCIFNIRYTVISE